MVEKKKEGNKKNMCVGVLLVAFVECLCAWSVGVSGRKVCQVRVLLFLAA